MEFDPKTIFYKIKITSYLLWKKPGKSYTRMDVERTIQEIVDIKINT